MPGRVRQVHLLTSHLRHQVNQSDLQDALNVLQGLQTRAGHPHTHSRALPVKMLRRNLEMRAEPLYIAYADSKLRLQELLY